jgi:hypothetical protein
MQSLWNTELLTDIYPIRVFEYVAVGIEDFWVQVAIAVILLGNLPQPCFSPVSGPISGIAHGSFFSIKTS